MKQNLPVQLLLALSVAVFGCSVLYSAAAGDIHPVEIHYSIPQEPRAAEPAETAQPLVSAAPELGDDAGERREEGSGRGEDEGVAIRFPLELNSADREHLQLIPGVGDVTSQRIVQYREVLGGYTSLDQLREIKGIGDATYASISPYLYVQGEGEWAPD